MTLTGVAGRYLKPDGGGECAGSKSKWPPALPPAIPILADSFPVLSAINYFMVSVF